MTQEDQAERFAQLVRQFEPHSRLLRAWPLKGGVSAQVTALEVERPGGQTIRLVVRQHGAADLRYNPQIAADEFRLLRLLEAERLPAPRPYHLDQSGELFTTPVIVIEYIEGAPEFAPASLDDYLADFAEQLARIHEVDVAAHDLSFLPEQAARFRRVVRERSPAGAQSDDERRICDTLEAAWPLAQGNRPALLHGDYWPGNLIWNNGRLAAIIDWEDAALGDRLADLANSRLEIMLFFGAEAMQQLTERYQSLAPAGTDYTMLPRWELGMALRPLRGIAGWGLEAEAEQAMRAGLRLFIEQAFARL
jgi:aminoglycoside phosphotransferase (APT) family kinase protein